MSCAVRPAPDQAAFIALIDGFAAEFGLPAYSEIARALHERDACVTRLHAALRAQTEHSAAAQVLLLHSGLDQPREVLEQTLEEALERTTAATEAGNLTLYVAEMRVDLDGRDDVVVLAEARERLRAAGRHR